MNKKGKKWLKKNWAGLTIHIMVLAVYLVFVGLVFRLLYLQIGVGSMMWSMFVTIMGFGGIITFSIIWLVIDRWKTQLIEYIKDYNKAIKKKG